MKFSYYAPAQWALSDDAVWRLSCTCGWRAVCAAGRLDGAYWLIGPGWAGLAQGCRCALPLQASAGTYLDGLPPTLQLVYYWSRVSLVCIINDNNNTAAVRQNLLCACCWLYFWTVCFV